jgi:hypothetical protein
MDNDLVIINDTGACSTGVHLRYRLKNEEGDLSCIVDDSEADRIKQEFIEAGFDVVDLRKLA